MNSSQRRRMLSELLRLLDLAIFTAVYFVAGSVGSQFGTLRKPLELLAVSVSLSDIFIFLGCLFSWNLVCEICGLNHSRRLSNLKSDLRDLLVASVLATTATGMIALFTGGRMASSSALLAYLILSCLGLILSRIVLRTFLGRARKRGRNLRHLVIVGANERAMEFARDIHLKPGLGYTLNGFVDDEWEGSARAVAAGHKVVSNLADFPAYLRSAVVDEVVICLPIQSMYLSIRRLAAECAEQGIMTRVFADFFEQTISVTRTDQFGGKPVLMVGSRGIDGPAALCKSFFDRVIALIMIVLLAPVLVATALLIKFGSDGPILFRQKRLGINKRPFDVFKFRTMVVDAEKKHDVLEHLNEMSGPVFKMKNDPRITREGQILRKLSIDELPQLFNVLLGDMSLVGPRPLPLRDYAGFNTNWHLRRFSVRPGISCLWQIQGRNSIPFEQWMELDMQYIDQWSFWLDLKILAKTIPAVLKGQGAS